MFFRSLSLLIAFFLSLQLNSQNNVTISDVEETVAQIKNHLQELRKTEKSQTIEGSKYCYYSANELKLVSVQEKGKIEKNVAWYFDNKFLLYTETNWKDTTNGKVLYSEKTYHTKQGRLLAWLNSESTFVDSSSEEFRKMDQALYNYATRLFNESEE